MCSLLSHLICVTTCVLLYNTAVYGQGQCLNGFTEQSLLPDLVDDAVIRSEGYLYLFFSVNFTCQFEVSSFILLATEDDGVGEYPFIQIWRETSTNFYNRINNIGNSDEVIFLGNSSYQYTPTSGNITVLPGDLLGLVALSNANSRITPFLFNQSSPQYYEVILGGSTQLTQVFANNQLNFDSQYSPLVAISPSTAISVTSTNYPTSSMVSSSTTSIPSSSPSPAIPSTMLILSGAIGGVIGGSIVAVVCIVMCLLMIAVHYVKKKAHYSETDGRAALDLQTLPSINIEQRSNLAYNHPTNSSATEMQSNAAYARSSANFNVPIVEGTEVDAYDTIQEEDNDNYI